MTTQRTDPDDIVLWPDGCWCIREELPGYEWKSDDYQVLFVDSPEYVKFLEDWDDGMAELEP